MLLSDKSIKEHIKSGKIKVEPFEESLVGSASLDLRIGSKFRVFRSRDLTHIDPKLFNDQRLEGEGKENEREIIHKYTYSDLVILKDKTKPFILRPGEFVLASVYEYIGLPRDIAAQICGRSSIARLGLLIHTSAGWVDPGYEGHLTLEIVNMNKVPVKIFPLMPVAQLMFFKTDVPTEIPYFKRKSSKYVKEPGATESRIREDFK